jgi:8-oxo-dGTP diphosphatase
MEQKYRNPAPTVDIIIELIDESQNPGIKKIILIKRKNPPYGWALPGGFVDYGESLEESALREAKEETSLDVELVRQFHTYSEPGRDPRQHTISTVFIARAKGKPKGMDDALKAEVFNIENLPEKMAFDHKRILDDYINNRF